MLLETMASAIMGCLWRASWQASVIGLLVMGLRWGMGSRLSPRWRGWLWLVVFLRLVLPALPPSPWSLFNLLPMTPAKMPVEIQWPIETIIIHVAPSRTIVPIPRKTTEWPTVLTAIWLSGAGVLLAATIFVNWRFARRIRFCTEPPQEIAAMMARLGLQMHIRRLPRTVWTDATATPALFGLFPPTLLLPLDFSHRMNESEIRFILLHELAHVHRRDLTMGWIGRMIRIVHWFNPLVWIFVACQRTDAESACDEMVLRITDADRRIDYGRTLLKLAERFSPALPMSALGVIDGKTELRRRILGIARFHRQAIGWSIAAILLLIVLVCVALTDARKASVKSGPELSSQVPVSRGYDVQDIIFTMILPEYGNAPQISIAGGANEPPPAARPVHHDPAKVASQLVEIIHKALPDEAFASDIDAPNFNRIHITVTAPPRVQSKIEEIINRMRADKTAQVSIATRVITFNPEDAQQLSFILPGDGPDAPQGPVFISDNQLNEIIRLGDRSRTSTELTAPRLTLFNHQKAYIVVSTDQAYVADYTATTQPNGEIGYAPKKATIPAESVLMDIRANETENHETTGMDIHVNLQRLDRLDPKTVKGHPELEFKIPREFVVDVSANVNVKTGLTALFAGGVDIYNGKLAFVTITPKLLDAKKHGRP